MTSQSCRMSNTIQYAVSEMPNGKFSTSPGVTSKPRRAALDPWRVGLMCLIAAAVGQVVWAGVPETTPETVGVDSLRLQRIDDIVAEGLKAGRMPGCVVCVGHSGRIIYLKAYGKRQVKPVERPMTIDTVFDMASITKPVATATSVMLLVERGQVRLRDRVSAHVPEFAQNGKQRITVQQLLLHQGGLIPDNALADYDEGKDSAMKRIYALKPYVEPGARFVYTDVGFIVLAELVRRTTGDDVHDFSQRTIFQPLGMHDTGFLPRKELRQRAAATEQREGRWMQGEVHDPRAYRLEGVAGHAGLFSTARDLAIYAQMLLNEGSYEGSRVLAPRTVATMAREYGVSSGLRGLGWDKQTGYSSNRGELFTRRAFGHGGFTGTTLWVDPGLDLFVIFLSNRVHPDGKGNVNSLAGRVGSVAAAAVSAARLPAATTPRTQQVRTGVDVLQANDFACLSGQRVGLITNHTGVDARGVSTVQVLHAAEPLNLVALFSPEHGFAGKLDQAIVSDSRDDSTGLKIYSLYGKTRQPTEEMLADLDTLVFDIQDIGTRFYTYVSTMGYAMQAAAERQLRFVVLDRPNPINGQDVAGPVLDKGRESFVGFHRIPVRHGMTVGELARMFQSELDLDIDLHVVRLQGWRRPDYFDATGLRWINPSPNMRCLAQALLYPGIGLLETTNLSVGRGTDTPFEVVGAPWIDGELLARELNRSGLPGVRFLPIRFQPVSSKFAGETCQGVNILVTNRSRFQPIRTGFEIAHQLHRLFKSDWQIDAYDRLLANNRTLQALRSGSTARQLMNRAQPQLGEFFRRRERYLLYP